MEEQPPKEKPAKHSEQDILFWIEATAINIALLFMMYGATLEYKLEVSALWIIGLSYAIYFNYKAIKSDSSGLVKFIAMPIMSTIIFIFLMIYTFFNTAPHI